MSAPAVLLRSSSIFVSSSLPLFLLLSAVLFSFRSAVHFGSRTLSTALDRDAHLQSLLSRLSSPPDRRSPSPNPLKFDALDPLPSPPSLHNVSFLLPNLTVLTLRIPNPSSPHLLFVPPSPPAVGDLNRRDALSLLYIACLFSAAHLYSIFGFLLSYSLTFGVVCFAATASLLDRPSSSLHHLTDGCRLGLRRLPFLLFLRWSLRDAIAQFLSILLFPTDAADHLALLKLFVRVKLLPFSLTALPPSSLPLTAGFPFFWALLDLPVSAIFAVNCWVAVMDRRGGRDILREGCFLASTVIGQVGLVRTLEVLVCGDLGMRVISGLSGPVPAMVAQSVAEVYFMVVWLMLYVSARSVVGDADGRSFGYRELEDLYDTLIEDSRRSNH